MTTAPKPLQKLTRSDFPDVGDKRFWEVTHNPKSRQKPITITLRESVSAGRRLVGMSRILGFDHAIADRDQIIETAKLIDARISNVDSVVGVF